MDAQRKLWNEGQQQLRAALTAGAWSPALDLFYRQHAMLHAAAMSGIGLWSFNDEVWQDLSPGQVRLTPQGGEHSLAWLTWHLARIEDVTMNILVAGGEQILLAGSWLARLGISERDTGNLSTPDRVERLSAAIDLEALQAYRLAVGRGTRQVVARLNAGQLRRKVEPVRLQRLLDEGAVVPQAADLLAYWGGLTIAGLLLMPPTRHNFVHLNEASRIKTWLAKHPTTG
jgi:hypothetical protein